MIRTSPHEESLKLPLDRRGFLRRECPGCHRHFKVRWSERDANLVQRRLSSLLVHGNEVELGGSDPERMCVYCGLKALSSNFWTEEQRQVIADRAALLGEEIRFEQLRHVERTLSQNPYLTYLPVPPEPRSALVRPEPDDMRVLPLLCCGEDVKVRESWQAQVICPFCGAQHDVRSGGP